MISITLARSTLAAAMSRYLMEKCNNCKLQFRSRIEYRVIDEINEHDMPDRRNNRASVLYSHIYFFDT